ncbi:MAG: Uncharacterized protein G01um10143_704 [Parcubacteria group bacterium Gr01-1014_3]|nr:MAG: Uncharacterized protein G01um10143_704 [Parcubacteria group bacterium Gr01-1014_3]
MEILNKKNSGFTLIETLMYSAIVTGFLTFALIISYQLIDSSDRSTDLVELNENQQFVTEKIGWVLSSVSAINIPASGATSASLSVNRLNYGGNPIVISLSEGTVMYSTSSLPAVPLTNSHVTVSDLNFKNLNFEGRVGIQFSANFANNTSSTSLENTFIVK